MMPLLSDASSESEAERVHSSASALATGRRLRWPSEKSSECLVMQPWLQGEQLANIRAVSLSGMVLADLSLPPSTRVHEVKEMVARLGDTALVGTMVFHLVLNDKVLLDDALVGELGLVEPPGWTALQVVMVAHSFSTIKASDEADHTFKLTIIGGFGVGKSSLVTRFINDSYEDQEHDVLTGVHFKTRAVLVDCAWRMKLHIWEIAWLPAKSSRPCHYLGVHAILIVFDIASREEFAHVPQLLSEARKLAHPNALVILVGSKCDVTSERQVSRAEANAFALFQQVPYFETSAKTGIGVQELFTSMLSALVDNLARGVIKDAKSGLGSYATLPAEEEGSTCTVS